MNRLNAQQDKAVTKAGVRPNTKSESGQSLVMLSLMLGVLLGLVGLVMDVGSAVVADQDAQSASDAASLAAAGVLRDGGTAAEAEEAALELAAANGYVDGEGDVEITVDIPPTSGPHAGDPDYAEVTIDNSSQNYFSSVLGVDFIDVQGRAVATADSVPGNYGIIALSENDCRSLEMGGNGSIEIIGGGIFVNSSCPTDAFYANGNISVETNVNKVVGGWDTNGPATVTPTPTSASQIEDPLADLPVPTPPTNSQTCPSFSGPPGATTLQPGVYNCTINPPGQRDIIFEAGDYHITGGVVAEGGSEITFNEGVYTLGGVGITVTGSGTINVNNAMLYIESGEAELTGNGVSNLNAPESGPYAGVAIFQDRASTTQVDLKGTAIQSGWGTIYAAGAEVSLVGTAASSNMQFISDTFSMSGTPDIELTFDSDITVGNPVLKLVE